MPSLLDLIEANIIIPGRNNISVSYKGTTYTASLEKDGAISYQGAPTASPAHSPCRLCALEVSIRVKAPACPDLLLRS